MLHALQVVSTQLQPLTPSHTCDKAGEGSGQSSAAASGGHETLRCCVPGPQLASQADQLLTSQLQPSVPMEPQSRESSGAAPGQSLSAGPGHRTVRLCTPSPQGIEHAAQSPLCQLQPCVSVQVSTADGLGPAAEPAPQSASSPLEQLTERVCVPLPQTELHNDQVDSIHVQPDPSWQGCQSAGLSKTGHLPSPVEQSTVRRCSPSPQS
jgi:hypothetical protein